MLEATAASQARSPPGADKSAPARAEQGREGPFRVWVFYELHNVRHERREWERQHWICSRRKLAPMTQLSNSSGRARLSELDSKQKRGCC